MSTSAIIIYVCVIVLAILIIVAISIIGYRRSKEKKEAKSEKSEDARMKEEAGAAGERAVLYALGEEKRGRKYIFQDYILDGKDLTTHEIDFLVVTRAGVFVLEVKNWGGTICGNIGDDEWEQYTGPAGDKLCVHQNPFKQNESHVKAVSAIVPSFVDIYSYVVLVNNSVDGDAKESIFSPETIGAEIDSKAEILTAQDTQTLALTIAGERSGATRSEHIENVKRNSKK